MQEKTKRRLDGDYPGLNGLSYAIGYLEQLLAILSEPLLIGCAALAVVDFMTAGRLLELPAIMYVWAGSLAISVTACFIVTWRRCIKAFTLNYYGAAAGLALMGAALGLVDWTAIDVQSLEQTMGVSFPSALGALGLDVVWITHLRAAVAIAMAVVVAISNHTAVTQAQRPARKLLIVEKLLDKIAPVVKDTAPFQKVEEEEGMIADVERNGTDEERARFGSRFPSKEQAVKQAVETNPLESAERLAEIAGVHPKTVKKWTTKWQTDKMPAVGREQSNGHHVTGGES